ncbi:hypothetical protein [Zwartia panacis]|jgi:hypothetical protein|uniref:hypothetical protein n=1 Tax=Zwartia panacis TaxID=2683345 RepID=UPI0025B525E3|nr:hypothetical protein [Zwartia panacis]MDN4017168.1 hypothetical protein [Zwartia panacis]
MPSAEDIKRIHAEEMLRQEIREEIEASKKSETRKGSGSELSQKLMDFLNSSVGMWLLSSVVLTTGAALIQQFQHDYQIREQNHKQLVTHLFEIQNRLDNMEYILRRAQTVGEAKEGLKGLFKSIFPLTPELENRSLVSLYFAVYSLIPGDRQVKAKDAIEFVREMEQSEFTFQSRPDTEKLNDEDREQLRKLIQACKAVHDSIAIQRAK